MENRLDQGSRRPNFGTHDIRYNIALLINPTVFPYRWGTRGRFIQGPDGGESRSGRCQSSDPGELRHIAFTHQLLVLFSHCAQFMLSDSVQMSIFIHLQHDANRPAWYVRCCFPFKCGLNQVWKLTNDVVFLCTQGLKLKRANVLAWTNIGPLNEH